MDARKMEAHKSALADCSHIKEKYEKCFTGWYRYIFLQGKTFGNNCDDLFDDYRACLIEKVHKQGLSHLEIFGPSPLTVTKSTAATTTATPTSSKN